MGSSSREIALSGMCAPTEIASASPQRRPSYTRQNRNEGGMQLAASHSHWISERTLVRSIKTARGDPRFLNEGGSVLLLSPTLVLCDDPTVPGSCQPPKFARRNFQERLARCHILDHKGSFPTPATNVAYLPLLFNHFIQFPPSHPPPPPHLAPPTTHPPP